MIDALTLRSRQERTQQKTLHNGEMQVSIEDADI